MILEVTIQILQKTQPKANDFSRQDEGLSCGNKTTSNGGLFIYVLPL